MNTSVYEARCDNCPWKMTLLAEHVIQYHAEEHMMESGHIVQIKEIN